MMTDTTDNPGSRKYAGRPFEKGNRGRPAGSRNKVTVAVESLMGEYDPQVTTRVIKRACEGDMAAARLGRGARTDAGGAIGREALDAADVSRPLTCGSIEGS